MVKKRVVVGMSGGVDSSLTALLLKEQGYEVLGLFMRNWKEQDSDGCCTAEQDFYDVRSVCNKLDIPYYSVDFADMYFERVFKHFLDEYAKGRTPNPDVLCNREIKFDPFVKHALSMGADYIATGHYCNVLHTQGQHFLLKAKDDNKDQTYFLNQVRSSQLEKVLFPIGNLDKPEVRELSAKYGLATADKKDSTGICFIGERNFRQFLSQYIPMKEGDIKTLDGKVVGRHTGVFYYTVGQRKGLGIGGIDGGEGKWFVVRKDVAKNILYVSQGDQSMLFKDNLICESFSFVNGSPMLTDGQLLGNEFACQVRIRHRQALQNAICNINNGIVSLQFETPQRAIAEGQYAVVYVGEVCIGGGVIGK